MASVYRVVVFLGLERRGLRGTGCGFYDVRLREGHRRIAVGAGEKVRCGGTPQPARGTRALPGGGTALCVMWHPPRGGASLEIFSAGRRKVPAGRRRYPECYCHVQLALEINLLFELHDLEVRLRRFYRIALGNHDPPLVATSYLNLSSCPLRAVSSGPAIPRSLVPALF